MRSQQPPQNHTVYRNQPAPQGNVWYAPISTQLDPAAEAPQKYQSHPSQTGNGAQSAPPRPPKRKSFGWQLFKFLLALIALAALAGWAYISKVEADIAPYTTHFLDNVYVDGINLSGMTWQEGRDAVWAQASAKQSGWYVRLKSSTGQHYDITSETLGIVFDPSQALEQAWAIGHSFDESGRKSKFIFRDEIEYMRTSKEEFFSIQPNADTAPIDTILSTLERSAFKAPQDAQILGFDPNNPSDPFSFQYEQLGQQLDTTAVKEQIIGMVQTFQSGEVLLTPTPLYPSQTVAELQKTISLRFRATTPIDRHSLEDRNNNIRLAFSKINGKTIRNGDKFSFNTMVGRRTQKNGYFPAYEYNYGELVTGFGGGVCQASTTVYLAALQAGMTILERTAHSTPVSYTVLGQDATVSDTRGREKDLVFRNNSGGDIFITAHVLPNASNKNLLICEVRIYGLSMGNTHYALESAVVEKLPKPLEVEYVEDKESKYTTYFGQEETVIKAQEGAVVETHLITIVDGTETDRKLVSKDTYPNRKARVYVGVNPIY